MEEAKKYTREYFTVKSIPNNFSIKKKKKKIKCK